MSAQGGAVRADGHHYFPEIDGLRAIAVLSVIVNHLSERWLPSGYLGVDVFFVISGYVITLSLLDRAHLPVREVVAEFYFRRIKRLAPALVVVVLAGAALIRLFDPAPAASAVTGILSLFGLSNLFLYYQSIDYFGASVQLNPFSHTWSLGVEEQFYLFFPLMLVVGARVKGLGLPFRAGLTALLGIASLAAFALVYSSNQPAAYFLLPFRFWELAAGCLIAILLRSRPDALRRTAARIPPAVPLALLFATFFLPNSHAVAATIAAVVCSGALLLSVRRGTLAHRMLTQRAVVYVGLLSYSLYLWHWIVICLSRWTIGIQLWTLPFQLALMLALAAASFHFIEDPLRRGRWFARRWMTTLGGLAGLAFAAGLVAAGHKFNLPAFSGSYALNEAPRAAPNPGYRGKVTGRQIDDCALTRLWSGRPETLRANIARCSAIRPGRPTLIFAGDSHAMDMFPVSELAYRSGAASILSLYENGCRVPPLAGEAAGCGRVPDVLGALPPDPGHRRILVLRTNFSPKAADGSLGAYARVLEPFVDRLTAQGYTLVYVAPSPKYASVGPGSLCSAQWFRPRWALPDRCRTGFVEDRGEQLARRQDYTDYLHGLARRKPGFLVFDPFDILCGDLAGRCTPVRGGELVYRDESHLTERGSESLAGPLLRFLADHRLLD